MLNNRFPAAPAVLNYLSVMSVALGLLITASCGSSSETVTVTSPVRCGIQTQADASSFAPDGGSAAIRISTNRECAWTARSDAPWVSLTPPTTGQGDGSIQFTIGVNADPAARAATIMIEDQRVQVAQEGRRCDFRLSSNDESFDATGGERTIQVTSASAQCRWTAVPGVPWITVVSGAEGSGSGAVKMRADALTGPPRTGIVTIAGQAVQVEQGTGCSYTIGTTAFSLGAAGGAREIPVSAPSGCSWTAESQAAWIAIASGATGSGAGTVGFRVEPTEGPTRTGTLTVAGRTVTVTQSPGCSYSVEPLAYAAPQAGGSTAVAVRTGPGCAWVASSASSWISITGGQSGNGPGEVRFSVTANSAQGRAGSLRIADQTVTVTQGSGCTYTVTPPSVSVGAAAATGAFQVATTQGCAWSAASGSDWITITAGQSVDGAGEVKFSVAANSGEARTGSLQIANQTVTVSQSSGCTFSVTPPSVSVGAAAGTGTFHVATAQGCAWSAASGSDWITITAGQSVDGPGDVKYSVAANSAPARTGSLQIANQAVTVSQSSGCTFSVTPPSVTVGAAAATGTFQVTTAQGCPWTAASGSPWITIAAGSSGNGPGQVPFSVAANSGPARDGNVSIAGRSFSVSQANGCTYSVAPTTRDAGPGGEGGAVSVTTGAGCPWTASSGASWITVAAPSGTGPAQAPFAVAANQGPPRTGTFTVAGQLVTVNQSSSCTWVMAPPSHAFSSSGGNGNILVIVTGFCTWTAASDVDWITLTAGGSGTGNGLVQFIAAPNNGPARTGSLTIAGQRYNVVEAGR